MSMSLVRSGTSEMRDALDNLLKAEVVVWIHPINKLAHPTYRQNYRWAVHVGGGPPSYLGGCCNAGSAPTLLEARLVGESHGVAVCKAVRIFGVAAGYSVQEIGWDPIPASADLIPAEKWGTGARPPSPANVPSPDSVCEEGGPA